jgi:hypothetical protein
MAELLLELSFDEASGNVIDHSGNGHDFALAANTVRTADGDGHTGRALTQTAIEQVQTAPAALANHPATWTWMCWVRISSSANGWVGESHWSTNDTGCRGLLYLSGSLNFRVKNPSNVAFQSAGLAPDFGNYHHVAATYDGTSLRTYRDGVQVGSAVTVTGGVQDGTTFRLLDGAGSVFRIDDFRLFDGVMDAAEIATWMATPAGPDPTAQVDLSGSFSSPTTAFVAVGSTNVGLEATFAVPAVEVTATASADVDLAAGFTSPQVAFEALARAELQLAGTFSIPLFSAGAREPVSGRDILVEIEAGDRPDTAFELGDAGTVVQPGSDVRTTVEAGSMKDTWYRGTEQFVDFVMTLTDPTGELTLAEVEAMDLQVLVKAGRTTPDREAPEWVEPSVTRQVSEISAGKFKVIVLHMYEATAKGYHTVWVKFGPTPERPIELAASFKVQ